MKATRNAGDKEVEGGPVGSTGEVKAANSERLEGAREVELSGQATASILHFHPLSTSSCPPLYSCAAHHSIRSIGGVPPSSKTSSDDTATGRRGVVAVPRMS